MFDGLKGQKGRREIGTDEVGGEDETRFDSTRLEYARMGILSSRGVSYRPLLGSAYREYQRHAISHSCFLPNFPGNTNFRFDSIPYMTEDTATSNRKERLHRTDR